MKDVMDRGLEAISEALIFTPLANHKNGDTILDFFVRSDIIDLIYYLRCLHQGREVPEYRMENLIIILENRAHGKE